MASNPAKISISGISEEKINNNSSSILLRLPLSVAQALRACSKKEERTLTTIATRALKMYFKNEHNLEVTAE